MSDRTFDAESAGNLIHPGERMDELQQAGLHILQKERGFRFGMDAILLASFARVEKNDRCADFGTGTGILPLLLAGTGRASHITAFELQPDMADMAQRSVRLNGLEARIQVHACPVEQADTVLAPGSLDVILCNPPYGLPGATLHNPAETLSLARHQQQDGLKAWFTMAYRLLRGKGRFAMIYPAPRMLEAMKGLERAGLAPKRFQLVYPHAEKAANLVLIEALKDAKPMLHPEPPLVVYQPNGELTPMLKKIYAMESASGVHASNEKVEDTGKSHPAAVGQEQRTGQTALREEADGHQHDEAEEQNQPEKGQSQRF